MYYNRLYAGSIDSTTNSCRTICDAGCNTGTDNSADSTTDSCRTTCNTGCDTGTVLYCTVLYC